MGRSRGVVAACDRLEKACPSCGANNGSYGYLVPPLMRAPARRRLVLMRSEASPAGNDKCEAVRASGSADELRA